MPGGVQLCAALGIAALVFLTVNWVYQVVHKPSELLFPVSDTLYKSPPETWSEYGSLFEKYSTSIMTPELLAALAQVEGSGNPIVRTYWRWSWRPHPFEVYRPASSAVGMYQLTDGTFAEARHYCIHDHHVVEDGPWDDWHTCWFNSLYMRIIPSDAIEMTSAYLDRAVTATLLARHVRSATLRQKQDLAAVIHLCGAGAGDLYVRRGLRLTAGQRCGDHEARAYVGRVDAMKRVFALLAAGSGSSHKRRLAGSHTPEPRATRGQDHDVRQGRGVVDRRRRLSLGRTAPAHYWTLGSDAFPLPPRAA